MQQIFSVLSAYQLSFSLSLFFIISVVVSTHFWNHSSALKWNKKLQLKS